MGAKTNGFPSFVIGNLKSSAQSRFRRKRNFSYHLTEIVFTSMFSKFFTHYLVCFGVHTHRETEKAKKKAESKPNLRERKRAREKRRNCNDEKR